MLRFSFGLICALLAAVLALSGSNDARAQFGGIFGNNPPRPPGTIVAPNGAEIIQDPDDEDVPDLPQGRVLPSRPPAQPVPQRPGQVAPAPGNVQSQPLPPPPGSAAAPQAPAAAPETPGQPPLPGLPAGQRQPRGNPAANATPNAPATLQPGDEVVTEPPAIKIPNKTAMFAGLDKITGRIIKFDAEIGETVQFGALRVTPRACYTRPATEAANTDAFIEVEEITLQGEVKKLFGGWMFAASPGLHAVEHPIYDVWLTDCKGPETAVASAPADPAKPDAQTPAAAKPPAAKRQPTAQKRPAGPPALPTPFPTPR